jgi:hypothetical protein
VGVGGQFGGEFFGLLELEGEFGDGELFLGEVVGQLLLFAFESVFEVLELL